MKFADGFANLAARLGFGTNKLFSASRYAFDFFTRNTTELEAAYRTNWIVGQIVDVVAEDMTRAGIEFGAGLAPDESQRMSQAMQRLQIFDALCEAVKWSRLYGGALAVLLFDGDDMATPLDVSSIGPGRFRGLLVLDRWQVEPSLSDVVTEYGPEFGKPRLYTVSDAGLGGTFAGARIHHSRVLRFEGIPLPYRQRVSEQGWGESVIERLRDRLTAYDSASQGTAQLVYKAHLRTYKVKGLREILASGGPAYEGLIKQLASIRDFQSNEGLTLADVEDEFQVNDYSFGGLADVLAEFGQQLSGATGIPLVRLFGQSPRGFSTGDTDLRNYYDMIRSKQAKDLDDAVRRVLAVLCMSELARPLPDGFSFAFASLWQVSDDQKAAIAVQDANRVAALVNADIFDRGQALEELRQCGPISGRYTVITDAAVTLAELEPPKAELDAMVHRMPPLSGKDKAQDGAADG